MQEYLNEVNLSTSKVYSSYLNSSLSEEK